MMMIAILDWKLSLSSDEEEEEMKACFYVFVDQEVKNPRSRRCRPSSLISLMTRR